MNSFSVILSCFFLHINLSHAIKQGETFHNSTHFTFTECDDSYECESGDFASDYVFCRGYYSCEKATMNSVHQINFGAYAASSSLIETSNTVYAYGTRVNYGATIETKRLLSYGYQSSAYSDIEAFANELEIEFHGYYSGFYANVYCLSGDSCTIYCGNSFGCYTTAMYCYSGSKCEYSCDSDEDYCPTIFSGIDSTVIARNSKSKLHFGMLSDDKINDYKQDRLETRKLKIVSKAENDIQLMEMAQARERKHSSASGSGSGSAHLGMEKDVTRAISVVEAYNHKHRKLGNSLFDKINSTGYGPLFYGIFGAFVTVLLMVCLNKCAKYNKDDYSYDEEYQEIELS